MAQLLVTIIAISLSAVALISGSYYGGQAYTDSVAKANAQQLIATAKQMADAWQAYSNDNMGYMLTDAVWSDGTATDLVPNYLASLPKVGFLSTAPYPIVQKLSGTTQTDNATDSNFIQFTLPQTASKIAAQVNLIMNGSATIQTNQSVASRLSTAKPMICYYSTASLNYYCINRIF